MNRYQQEVAEMDRRHALLVRIATIFGSAILIFAALWNAGLPPTWWWQAEPTSVAREASERPTDTVLPPSRAADASSGTDSSTASVPQPLLLVSTAPGRNEREGTARIGTSRGNPQTYVAGAILVNGARVAEIHRDHVVLERDEQRFALFVADSPNAGKRQSEGAGELATTAAPAATQRLPSPARDRLSEVMRTMAHYENDRLVGLRIAPGKKSGKFAQLGLRSGDLVTALDGVEVSDPQAAIEMLRTLLDGAALSVRIRRDDRFIDVALDGSIMVENQ